ncbi:MAG TPA: aminotransferase class I/II-fold pyridoxal phosphate-dependent enzyme [Bacillota bacterium]
MPSRRDDGERWLRPATLAPHAFDEPPLGATRPAAPPIHLASVYTFNDLDQVERVWTGSESGYAYGRFGSPNVDALEAAIARLEGADAALAAASGMAAITAILLGAAGPGGTILAGRDLYGGTLRLLTEDLPAWGYRVELVERSDPALLADAARRVEPDVIYAEVLTNPRVRVVDLPALAAVARRAGARLVVDNTFGSPVLCRALDLGADAVVHSATKYLSGHADVIAGVAAGGSELIGRAKALCVRLGARLDPFAAWLTLRGLATLDLRVRRQSENALRLARYLAGHPAVARVDYPGLPSDPDHALARRLLPEGAGGMLAFELKGGEAAADRFVARLELIRFAPSLGDVKTTVSHPVRTSHRGLDAETLRRLGVGPGLVRLSTGIEDPDDLIVDLDRALEGLTA